MGAPACAPGYLSVLMRLCLIALFFSVIPSRALPVEVVATPVSLNYQQQLHIGQLTFLNGFVLQSPDRQFGGLSGVALDAQGQTLYAVSDRGWWFSAHLSHDPEGRLLGIDTWDKGRLQLLPGQRRRHALGDAEALVREPDGSFLVAFEGAHRLWHYPKAVPPFAASPVPIALPVEVSQAPGNGGLEAVTRLASGALLLLTEEFENADGTLKGWLLHKEQAAPVSYAMSEGFRPTDLAALPDGDALVLERRYNLLGPAVRIRHLARAHIQPNALLQGKVLAQWGLPLTVDNFEGLAVRFVPPHGLVLYLLSDNNFNAFQRTLLLQFRLELP